MQDRTRFRLPRPKTFLGFVGLQSGTEIITLILAFNKATGLYGLLAILTGYSLSILQLSTYIYSFAVLACLAYLLPHIRRQNSLECLALAWLYALDTIINCAYTTAFAVTWYLANSAEVLKEEEAVAAGHEAQAEERIRRHDSDGADQTLPQDTVFSLVLIAAFTLVRVYFSMVVASYAQQVLRKNVDHTMINDGPRAKVSDGPFAVDTVDGEGWRGRLGRSLVSIGNSYWLDLKDQENWAKKMNERFQKPSQPSGSAVDS